MKIFIVIILTSIVLLSTYQMVAQEPKWLVRIKQLEWMSIVSKMELLKTTRLEAEKNLGKPDVFSTSPHQFYTIENGRVVITYTTKECMSKNGRVSNNVIKVIDFWVDSEISFSNLKIPLAQFKKSTVYDAPDAKLYGNKQYGIIFGVKFDKLTSIQFSPPKSKEFICPN